MTGKMSPRLSSLCGALILVCMFGAFAFPHAAFESQAKGNHNDSISYAKQTIWDLSPLPNRGVRPRVLAAMRNVELEHGVAQPLFLSTFPTPYVINSHITELPLPQSLAVFNPTTRSPPSQEALFFIA